MGRVSYHPHRMRKAANFFEHQANASLPIVDDLRYGGNITLVPRADQHDKVRPELERILAMTRARSANLKTVSEFIRAKALLVELGDAMDKGGKLKKGRAGDLLPSGAQATQEGIRQAYRQEADLLERAFLAGDWEQVARRKGHLIHNRPGGHPATPPWKALSGVAKQLGQIGGLEDGARAVYSVFHEKSDAKRIKAVSGILGEHAGSGLAVLTTVGLMTAAAPAAAPLAVGAAAIVAAMAGQMLGKKAGELLGEHVITPAWNGVKDLAKGISHVAIGSVKGVVSFVT
jgi:hypothetical protein